MASRKLFFDGLSESEDDSQQGSSSERGVDPNVDISATSGWANEATNPLEFEDETVEATVGSVVTSGQVVTFWRWTWVQASKSLTY